MRCRSRTGLFALVLIAGVFLEHGETASQPAAPPETALAGRLRDFVAASGLGGRELGISVVDIASGRLLFSHNPTAPLNPASNAKIVTAAAALVGLHPEYQWLTAVHARARAGGISGNVYLKGYGDPTLDTGGLLALAQELRADGIRHVDGSIVVDDSFFDRQYTPPAFDQQPHEDAAFRGNVGGVNINRNTAVFRVSPGSTDGEPGRVTVDPPGAVRIDNETVTGATTSVRIGLRFDESSASARVWGTVAAGGGTVAYRKRIENPSVTAGFAFRDALRSVGIRVAGEGVAVGSTPPGTPLLASRESRPLSAVLYELGKASDNFTAETVFKTLGAERKGRPGSWQRAKQAVEELMARYGLPAGSLTVMNGSGLYDANRITAQALTLILRGIYLDPSVSSEFVSQLATGGADGTLRNRLRGAPAERVVRAKTGTLDAVVSLSGYVLAPPGRSPVAFAVLANGVRGRQSAARQLSDELVTEIVRYVHRRQ